MEKIIRFGIVVLICICPKAVFTQNLDSILLQANSLLKENEVDEALILYEKGIEIAELGNQFMELGKIHNNIGVLYKIKGRFEESFNSFSKARMIYKDLGNDSLLLGTETNLGNLLSKVGLYQESLPHFIKALKISSKLNSIESEASVCDAIGNIYFHLGEFNYSELYHQKALTIYASINDEKSVGKVVHNLAELYLYIGDLEKAEINLNIELSIKTKLGLSLASNTILFGELYLNREKWEKAYSCFSTVLEDRLKTEKAVELASAYYHLGDYYYRLNSLDIATKYLDTAMFWSDSLLQRPMTIDILKLQLKIDKLESNNPIVFDRFEKLTNLKDSVLGINSRLMASDFSVEYEVLKKDKELELKQSDLLFRKAENNNLSFRYKMALFVSILFLILLTVIIIFSQRLKKKKESLQLQNKIISDLHLELNHRTKNYYQMFSGMLVTDLKLETDALVRETLQKYSSRVNAMAQIQHHLIYDETQTREQIQFDIYLSELVEEIDLALNHQLPKVEWNNKFEPCKLDYQIALYSGLVVNELIQNAFKHGFKAIEHPKLCIKMFQTDGKLFLIVIDNGNGFKTNNEMGKHSLGMTVVENLVQKIKASCAYSANKNGGVKVEISIPMS